MKKMSIVEHFVYLMKDKGGFFWMIPAAMALAGAASGAAKHGANKKDYRRRIASRNKRRTFAAFTGDMPNEANAPERPNALSTIGGGLIGGARTGLGLMNAVGSGSPAPNQDYTASAGSMSNMMNNPAQKSMALGGQMNFGTQGFNPYSQYGLGNPRQMVNPYQALLSLYGGY